MPRIARLIVKGESAVYHVISLTALDGLDRLRSADIDLIVNSK